MGWCGKGAQKSGQHPAKEKKGDLLKVNHDSFRIFDPGSVKTG